MSETQKMEVIVQKSNINLQAGETLSDFTSALSRAGKDHIAQKLNLPSKPPAGKSYLGWGSYTSEIFSKNVVAAVWKDDGPTKYYAFSYERDPKTKSFKFGDTTEVERVTSFRAKPATAFATKSKESCGDTAFDVIRIEETTKGEAPIIPHTDSATSNLPNMAFAVVVSAKKSGLEPVRYFPHHTKAVRNASEHSSIDVTKLRNGLALLEQTEDLPVSITKAGEHLRTHAQAFLTSRGMRPDMVKKDSAGLINALDSIMEPAIVAKSVDGGLWVKTGDDFWKSL